MFGILVIFFITFFGIWPEVLDVARDLQQDIISSKLRTTAYFCSRYRLLDRIHHYYNITAILWHNHAQNTSIEASWNSSQQSKNNTSRHQYNLKMENNTPRHLKPLGDGHVQWKSPQNWPWDPDVRERFIKFFKWANTYELCTKNSKDGANYNFGENGNKAKEFAHKSV